MMKIALDINFSTSKKKEQIKIPLFKYVKKADGTYGYDENQPIFLNKDSSEQIHLNDRFSEETHSFRSCWVATIANLNFPKITSEEHFHLQFQKVLDPIEQWNMNSVIFQIRPLSDAYYPSTLNPWSQFLTGEQGKDPGFDPLQYMVDKTHERGMEYHAYFNPYRVTNTKFEEEGLSIAEQIRKLVETKALAANNYAVLHPDHVLRFAGKLFLNPGIPEVRTFITDTIEEVIRNYDVDAIHFDDYFYPYSTTIDGKSAYFGDKNEDKETFEEHGKNYPDTKDGIEAWRRDNITQLITQVQKQIKQHNEKQKLAVQFGISPFAIWEHKANDPRGSHTPTTSSKTFSKTIFADTYQWVKDEKIDYLLPQTYWSFDQRAAPYGELATWWDQVAQGKKVHLYSGQANYKYIANGATEAAWRNPEEIYHQLLFNQDLTQFKGFSFFNFYDLIYMDLTTAPPNEIELYKVKNKNIAILKEKVFHTKVLLPEKQWLSFDPIAEPTEVHIAEGWLTCHVPENTKFIAVFKSGKLIQQIGAKNKATIQFKISQTGAYQVSAINPANISSKKVVAEYHAKKNRN